MIHNDYLSVFISEVGEILRQDDIVRRDAQQASVKLYFEASGQAPGNM